jgi:hypothetical protein
MTNSLHHNFLPENFVVYVSPTGEVVNWPARGYQAKILPTVNIYTEHDGGYISCYSHNKEGGVYSAAEGIYAMGQIRLQGKYTNQVFQPNGYEGQDISSVQELKDLCNSTFPACDGDGWAGGDTGGWFGLRADPFDSRDIPLDLLIPKSIPESTDLREWCSPVKNQGNLNSCTAHAAAAIVEYFEMRSAGRVIDASRLFLYKTTRNLLHYSGDTGANTRATMKALVMLGVTPEEFYPYDETKVNEEPSAFCYSLADNFKSVKYYRIDTRDRSKDSVLQHAKTLLAANRPLMLGFMAYLSCWQQAGANGMIPFPVTSDIRFGGHNVAVVGYDDNIIIRNRDITGVESTGAFLFKNSYGDQWGEKGYGWLPYDYLLKHQSIDWWTIIKQDWLDTRIFE